MNYPRPNNLSGLGGPKPPASYLAVPGYNGKFIIPLKSGNPSFAYLQDYLNTEGGGGFVTPQLNSTFVSPVLIPSLSNPPQHLSYEPIYGQPIQLYVRNLNTQTVDLILFDSFNTRTAANFGNVAGVSIENSDTASSYSNVLRQSESRPWFLGKIKVVEIKGTDYGFLAWQLQISNQTQDGGTTTHPGHFYTFPASMIPEADCVFRGCHISGRTKVTWRLPANCHLLISFYPEPEPPEMDPSVLSALRG